MKSKAIPRFEKISILNINVFEFYKTMLTPVYVVKNYSDKSLIKQFTHETCRYLTAFGSQNTLKDQMERCIEQQPTKSGLATNAT